ncbi:hypothetical protein LINPERPRIM_LOCUS33612 [Linum perenne]
MSHVVYTNDHMRDASHRAIFNNFFLGRNIITPTVLETTPFSRYNLNPDTLIAALGWGPVITEQPTKVYPDTVYQFYANLKLEGPLTSGKFSTYVDGHVIIVTPLLLAQVLGLPLYGDSISSLDQFYLADFNPCDALSHWTGETYSDQAFSTVSKLPDNLKVFHFFLTRILLPRSHGQFLVTPMDTWIMHSTIVGRHLNFCSLMFASMVHFRNPEVNDDLPFGGFISALVERLGVPLAHRFFSTDKVDYLRTQHVFRRIGWSCCVHVPANGSGGGRFNISGMDADVVDDLATQAELKLRVWCDFPEASDFEGSPNHPF